MTMAEWLVEATGFPFDVSFGTPPPVSPESVARAWVARDAREGRQTTVEEFLDAFAMEMGAERLAEWTAATAMADLSRETERLIHDLKLAEGTTWEFAARFLLAAGWTQRECWCLVETPTHGGGINPHCPQHGTRLDVGAAFGVPDDGRWYEVRGFVRRNPPGIADTAVFDVQPEIEPEVPSGGPD